MKTKVLIVEDNHYKYFTAKQVLEAQLKVSVRGIDVADMRELAVTTSLLKPDVVMFRPNGGVAELLSKLKKRRTNRRNTEIVMILTHDIDEEMARRFRMLLDGSTGRGVAEAA